MPPLQPTRHRRRLLSGRLVPQSRLAVRESFLFEHHTRVTENIIKVRCEYARLTQSCGPQTSEEKKKQAGMAAPQEAAAAEGSIFQKTVSGTTLCWRAETPRTAASTPTPSEGSDPPPPVLTGGEARSQVWKLHTPTALLFPLGLTQISGNWLKWNRLLHMCSC